MSDVTINWFEIPVTDVGRAAAFYSTILDRPMGEMPGPDGQPMHVFMAAEGPSGALTSSEDESPAQAGTVVYLNCPDIDGTLSRTAGAGGEVLTPKTAIGPFGFIAHIRDTEGNRVGLHVGT